MVRHYRHSCKQTLSYMTASLDNVLVLACDSLFYSKSFVLSRYYKIISATMWFLFENLAVSELRVQL